MAYPTDPIYKLIKSENREVCVMKKEGDNTLYIPITSGSKGNRYYEQYLEWVSEGGVAEAAD